MEPKADVRIEAERQNEHSQPSRKHTLTWATVFDLLWIESLARIMGSASEKDELLVFSTVNFNLYGEPTILNPSTLRKGRDAETEEEKNKKKRFPPFMSEHQGHSGAIRKSQRKWISGKNRLGGGIKSKAEKDFFLKQSASP